MFKKTISIFCIVLLLSTVVGFADSNSSIIKPRLGGGSSEFWFYEPAYNVIVNRRELIKISYDLEKMEREQSNWKRWKIIDIVAAVGGSYYGPIAPLSLNNLESEFNKEIRYGIEDVFRSLSRYPASSSRFRLKYTNFYTETKRSSFTTVTGCDIK